MVAFATKIPRISSPVEVFKILNGYENIDSNIFFLKIRPIKAE